MNWRSHLHQKLKAQDESHLSTLVNEDEGAHTHTRNYNNEDEKKKTQNKNDPKNWCVRFDEEINESWTLNTRI